MSTFKTKADVNEFLVSIDMTQPLSKICKKVVDKVTKEDPSLFDTICEKIEGAQTNVSRYGNSFLATMWDKEKTFQISYEASRVPKSYAFVCILKMMLPE